MTARAAVGFGAGLWVGATLLLSVVPWFARPSLADRLGPYAPRGASGRGAGLLSVASFRELLGPAARAVGGRLARVMGVNEELEVRLARLHAPLDVTAFRVRQVGAGVAGLGAAAVASVALGLPASIATLFLLAGPALGFLVTEQGLARQSAARQRQLFLELPVVAEQLAMLLTAGWSLTSGLNRLAARSSRAVALDLGRVCRRIRQGLPESDALLEWAAVARVPALDRLVPVLALNRETGDLARLISEEARAIRRDVHRELIETVERRNQQVWIPVTVAALVPGVLFMAIPFIEALRLFGS
ncbi:MAG: type II secretion system F family protein [Acidobacteria bacterium]|nr:type II secretion system F family protein [Acidobacteriota bacterium]